MSELLDRLIIQKNPVLDLEHYKNVGADGAYQVAEDLLNRLKIIGDLWNNATELNEHQLVAGGSSCHLDCPCCAIDKALKFES